MDMGRVMDIMRGMIMVTRRKTDTITIRETTSRMLMNIMNIIINLTTSTNTTTTTTRTSRGVRSGEKNTVVYRHRGSTKDTWSMDRSPPIGGFTWP